MTIIDVPNNINALVNSVSLTGVTVLKDNKYKARHAGYKVVEQVPTKGFRLIKKPPANKQKKKVKPKECKKVFEFTQATAQAVKKVFSYKVNKKEVSHRIRNMVNQMKGEKRLFFWTVTFPSGTSDDTAFVCFNKWLTRLRRDLNLRSYIWVAERQDGKRLDDKDKMATGTIHFHIAIHQRICVQKANKFMRACLFTCIDNNEINYSREAAKNYNGVDIAKDRKTKKVVNFALQNKSKSLVTYITKYVSKNKGEFPHLAYHCSRDYSNLVICFRATAQEFTKVDWNTRLKVEPIFENEFIIFYGWITGPPKVVSDYLAFVNQTIIHLVTNK